MRIFSFLVMLTFNGLAMESVGTLNRDSLVQELFVCTICQESINSRLLTTACGHTSHDDCLAGWAYSTERAHSLFNCPLCRFKLDHAIIPGLNSNERNKYFGMRFLSAFITGMVIKKFPYEIINISTIIAFFSKTGMSAVLGKFCQIVAINRSLLNWHWRLDWQFLLFVVLKELKNETPLPVLATSLAKNEIERFIYFKILWIVYKLCCLQYKHDMPMKIEQWMIVKKLGPIDELLDIIKRQLKIVDRLENQLKQSYYLHELLFCNRTFIRLVDGGILSQSKALYLALKNFLLLRQKLASKKDVLAIAQQKCFAMQTRALKNFLPEIITSTCGFYLGYKFAAPVLNNRITQTRNAIYRQVINLNLTLP